MKFGLWSTGSNGNFDSMRKLFQAADRLGFDGGFTMDNSTGGIRGHPDTPVFDTWTILPALAEATDRIRLGPLVTPARRRHPAVLAKMTSVFDVISNGRLILGMGASDWEQFWVPWGMGFPPISERIAILREEIEIIHRMWRDPRASFEGTHYSIDEAINNPKPVQDPHPPVWIGISDGRRLMPRIAADLGDGVNIGLGSDEACRERLDDVAAACKESGRDLDELTKSTTVYVTLADERYDYQAGIVRHAKELELSDQFAVDFIKTDELYHWRAVGSADQIGEKLARIGQLGFDYLVLDFSTPEAPLGGDVEGEIGSMEAFAADIMPHLT